MDHSAKFKVVNRATGSTFYVDAGETVLAAARRQGVHLSFSCLNGTCASCHATVVAGDWHYPFLPPRALSDEEQQRGEALLCQAVPLSDMTVVAREPAALKNVTTRVLDAEVAAARKLADDVMQVFLRLPEGEQFDYLAGQHLEILLPEDKRRAFSIANAPHRSRQIELHIRQVPGGDFTDFVFSSLHPGTELCIEAPLGTFFLRDRSERDMICVAGGTGFSPIKAIIEHFIANGEERTLRLYWGARTEPDLYLRELPEGWAKAYPNIYFIPVLSEPGDDWNGRTGLVHEAVLADHPSLEDFDIYMSGPPPLIEAGRRQFALHGLPESHLYYDSFEFAPDVLAKMSREA